MPSQNRVGRDDRGDALKHAPAEWLAVDREASPLIVVQAEAFLAEVLTEDAVLLEQIRRGQVVVDPAT